jgi:hypothetical protein
MSNPRDTQFIGFAKLLMQDLLSENRVYTNIVEGYGLEESQEIIARRAYDFALHVLSDSMGFSNPEQVVSEASDLTEWSKDGKP